MFQSDHRRHQSFRILLFSSKSLLKALSKNSIYCSQWISQSCMVSGGSEGEEEDTLHQLCTYDGMVETAINMQAIAQML